MYQFGKITESNTFSEAFVFFKIKSKYCIKKWTMYVKHFKRKTRIFLNICDNVWNILNCELNN